MEKNISTIRTYVDIPLEIKAALQRSTECTSVVGHSSQHNITQYGMLPQ